MGFLGWGQNLAIGGGEEPTAFDALTYVIDPEDNTFFAYKGVYDMKTVYIGKTSNKKKVVIDWSNWLNSGSSIASDTWVSSPTGVLTLSNESSTSTTSIVYINSNTIDSEVWLTNQITTDDSIALIEERNILVKTVRT
jgi:hypothetical protein